MHDKQPPCATVGTGTLMVEFHSLKIANRIRRLPEIKQLLPQSIRNGMLRRQTLVQKSHNK
jgi:hypothetical protein